MKKLLLTVALFSLQLNCSEQIEEKVSEEQANKKLFDGILKRDFNQIKQALNNGANADAEVVHGTTALMQASALGCIKIVKLLVARGANIEAEDISKNSAFTHAALYGHLDVAKLLIENGANIDTKDVRGNTPLIYASRDKYLTDIVKLLIQNGADINAKDNDTGESILICPSMRGITATVELLLKAGVNVNSGCNTTALIKASQSNHKELVKLLEKWIQYDKEYENDKHNGFKNCAKSITLTNYLIDDLTKIVLEYLGEIKFIDWMKYVYPEEFIIVRHPE